MTADISCAIITQARLGSTRLPGKVLERLAGRTVLEHHLRRLAQSGHPVVVATTEEAGVEQLTSLCRGLSVPVFQGSTDDVLARFTHCARAHKVDVVVRVTSDCPLVDGGVIAEGVDRYLALDNERVYLSNTQDRTYPTGFDFEVFSQGLLEEAHRKATARHEREHVTPFLYSGRDPSIEIVQVLRQGDASRFRVTLDTAEDLALLRRLFEEHDGASKNAEEIISLLEGNPSLSALNEHVKQKKLGE